MGGRQPQPGEPGAVHLAALVTARTASSAGYFALLPFLGLWLVDRQGLSGAQAGLVVAATIVATRAGGLLLVPAIRRIGARGSVLWAYAGGATLLTVVAPLPALPLPAWLAGCVVLGLCLSAATTAMKSLVATAYPAARQLTGFTYLNVAVNAGSAVGPALAGVVLSAWPGALPLLGAVLLGVAAAAALWLPHPSTADTGPVTGRRDWGRAPRAFLVFILLTTGTWFAYAQVFTVLPVFVAPEIDPAELGWVFTLNAVLVIALQVPIGSLLVRLRPAVLFLTANLGMAAAVAVFGLGPLIGMPGLLAAMFLFTLAELVWSPLYDTEVNVRRGGLSSPAAYGAAGLVWGGAEAFGAWFGSALVVGAGGAAPYWIGAVLSIGTGAAIAVSARGRGEPAADAPQPAVDPGAVVLGEVGRGRPDEPGR